MNNRTDRRKLVKMILTLLCLILVMAVLSFLHQKNSMTLTEYEKLNQDSTISNE